MFVDHQFAWGSPTFPRASWFIYRIPSSVIWLLQKRWNCPSGSTCRGRGGYLLFSAPVEHLWCRRSGPPTVGPSPWRPSIGRTGCSCPICVFLTGQVGRKVSPERLWRVLDSKGAKSPPVSRKVRCWWNEAELPFGRTKATPPPRSLRRSAGCSVAELRTTADEMFSAS